MKVKIVKLRSDAQIPKYQSSQAAAVDLHAAIDKPITLKSLERAIVGCGFSMQLPNGYEAQIRARSGLSAKHGIAMANGVGTIDADYRGEICAIVVNLSNQTYTIQPKDRIAQMIIAKYQTIEWQLVKSIEPTDRGKNAFGSTGN